MTPSLFCRDHTDGIHPRASSRGNDPLARSTKDYVCCVNMRSEAHRAGDDMPIPDEAVYGFFRLRNTAVQLFD